MLNKLQILQNAVARYVFQLLRRSIDSIKPLLKPCNQLSIIYNIKYKLSLITHKIIHHNSPDYLVPFLSRSSTTNNIITRSSNTFLLDTNISITISQTILVLSPLSAPYSWNSLPAYLRSIQFISSFKRHLKPVIFSSLHHKPIWTTDCLGMLQL